MPGITQNIIINAPIEKAFDCVADFESYPEFLSETKDVTILESGKKEMLVSFSLEIIKRIEYTLRLKLNRPKGISWTLENGQMMKHNNGSWQFKKISPKKTKAVYSIDIGFGLFVPNTISNMLIENNLPEMLKSFKERVEKG